LGAGLAIRAGAPDRLTFDANGTDAGRAAVAAREGGQQQEQEDGKEAIV
jgi:hypothetical protein